MAFRLLKTKRIALVAGGSVTVGVGVILLICLWPESCPFVVEARWMEPSEIYYGDFGNMRLLTLQARNLKDVGITFDREAKLTARVDNRWRAVIPDPYWIAYLPGRPGSNVAVIVSPNRPGTNVVKMVGPGRSGTNMMTLVVSPVRPTNVVSLEPPRSATVKILVPAKADACRIELRYYRPPVVWPMGIRTINGRFQNLTPSSRRAKNVVSHISQGLYDWLWPKSLVWKPTWRTNTVELSLPATLMSNLPVATNAVPARNADAHR